MKRLVVHVFIVLQIPRLLGSVLLNRILLTKFTYSPSHHPKLKQHGRSLLRKKELKPRPQRRKRTYDTTRRLASGSANGDIKVLIRLVRTIGLLRWTRKRRESERRVLRGKVMDGERGKKRFDGMRDYSVQMRESIGKTMGESEWIYEEWRVWNFHESLHCMALRAICTAGVLWNGILCLEKRCSWSSTSR